MTANPVWTAVAKSRAVGSRPHRVVHKGAGLVLFRESGMIRCLVDRCPHRGAPLSSGRVSDGLIECPYHGWRFDGSGLCREMPGLADREIPRIAIPTRSVCEEAGLVFVSDGAPATPPYVCALPPGDRVMVIVESRVRASLVDVAENILDATHTHFTHSGLLRGLGARKRIRVSLSAAPDRVEARYEGETRQEGLISRLLEGGRTISVGRFMRPDIAELEFHGPHGINLVTTFHLSEETPGQTRGFAVLAAPRQRGLGILKAAVFLPLFRLALAQDRRILEACTDNRDPAAASVPVLAPLDILRPHIEAVRDGRMPVLAASAITMAL